MMRTSFDEIMKTRARTENCPIPGDFERRVKTVIEALPEHHARRVSRHIVQKTVAIAAVICLLAVSTLAVSPTLRDTLAGLLGSFEPYSQTVDGVSVTDQGIQVRVLSTIADENDGMAYLEITDLTGNRLDESTAYDRVWLGCAAYDPDADTALFSYRIAPQDRNGDGTATISIGRFLPGVQKFEGVKLPWELVTDQKLETLTAEEIEGETGNPALVLKPGQTPAQLNTDLFTLSSMGFDSRGDFHVQIAFADGVAAAELATIYTETMEGAFAPNYDDRCIDSILLENGKYLDITYTMYTIEHFGEFRVDDLQGTVTTKPVIEGEWSLTFPLEILPERTVTLEEILMDMHLETFRITAMSLRLETACADPEHPAYLKDFPVSIFCQDGTSFRLTYSDWAALYQDEEGNMSDGGGMRSGIQTGEKERYGALYLWSFPQAVDPADVVGVSIGQRYIPLNDDTAGEGYWLEQVPE